MSIEYWATMSIYDHSAPYFRPSLLLFDRLVMPVPIDTWKGLSDPSELEQLSAEADWLQERGCALRFDWDPQKFQEWQANELNASASTLLATRARGLSEDPQLNTRYQLQQLVESGALGPPKISGSLPPVVVPLFGSRDAYQQLDPERFDVDFARQVTVDVVLDALPIAPPDVPLDDVLRLRESGFVTEQVGKLRDWQMELLNDLLATDDPGRWSVRIEQAENQLRTAVRDYTRSMGEVVANRRSARLKTLFSVLRSPASALGRIITEHRDEFSLVGTHERSWKALYQKSFAHAGVICIAKDLDD